MGKKVDRQRPRQPESAKKWKIMTHLPLYLINLQYFTKMNLTPEKWIILSF